MSTTPRVSPPRYYTLIKARYEPSWPDKIDEIDIQLSQRGARGRRGLRSASAPCFVVTLNQRDIVPLAEFFPLPGNMPQGTWDLPAKYRAGLPKPRVDPQPITLYVREDVLRHDHDACRRAVALFRARTSRFVCWEDAWLIRELDGRSPA